MEIRGKAQPEASGPVQIEQNHDRNGGGVREEKIERGGERASPGPRETPRKGMNKMAGLYRNQKLGEGKPSLWVGRV